MKKTIIALVLSATACCAVACNPDPAPPPVPSAPAIEDSEPLALPTPMPASSAPRFDLRAQAVGPIRLGMTRAELGALGLPVKPDESVGTSLWVGPYRVMFSEDGRADFVQFELAALDEGLAIGDHHVAATDKDIERIAALLPGCGELEIRLGGNVIECAGGKAVVAAAGPPGIVQLTLMSEARARSVR